MHTRYPVKALNSFIAFGLWGFIHSSPGPVTDEIGDQARKLIKDLISSDIFFLKTCIRKVLVVSMTNCV